MVRRGQGDGSEWICGGWRAWDERYADLAIGKRNWQLIAAACSIVSLVLAAGMVWQASRSRYLLYVVQVDKQGYALTQPQPLTAAAMPDLTARMERYEVAAFIRDARTVTSDPQVEHQMLNALLAHATRRSRPIPRRLLPRRQLQHNPFKLAEKQTVTIQIDSILQLSPKLPGALDGAAARSERGGEGAPTHWEAVLQTEIVPPRRATRSSAIHWDFT